MIKQVNSEEFKKEIKDGVVFVDFFANWCGPCKMLSPVVEQLSEDIKDVKFIKVDVDAASEVAAEYGVMSIPTLIIFKDGKEISKQIGLMPKDALVDFINENK
ncbi:MAG: thioredoxin [Bacilli bacterium]|nr:thioredoxin [Bacilli bacterium]